MQRSDADFENALGWRSALRAAKMEESVPMPSENRISNLNDRLERLEQQISRLADLLADQAQVKRRRRLLTIRFLLVSVIAFAVLFAWFGTVYRQSRRQSHAVEQLIGSGAFVLYGPSESALVSLLPGDSRQPAGTFLDLLGDDFFRSVTNVSTGGQSPILRDKQTIIQALTSLPDLKRLRLTNLQWSTDDLVPLGVLDKLQSLDLKRTRLDSGPMRWLRSTKLRWFDASHTCIGDLAMYDLSHCRDLQELRLERTCVTDAGLKHLHGLSQLRYLNLRRSPVSLEAVRQLSAALPGCQIDWEPLRFLPDGRVDVRAARRGHVRLGQRLPQDPRASRRAEPPLDSAPVDAWGQYLHTIQLHSPAYPVDGSGAWIRWE